MSNYHEFKDVEGLCFKIRKNVVMNMNNNKIV